MSENPQTTTPPDAEPPKKRLTQRDLEMQAGKRGLQQHTRNRSQETEAGKAGAAHAGDNAQRAQEREAAKTYEAGQTVPPPNAPQQANAPAKPNEAFETVEVQSSVRERLAQQEREKSTNTETQGSAPNAGQDTGDRVNRNPANNPDQALVARADNDAAAGEEAKSVTVMDRDHGAQNAGPMVDVDTTKTGPSGAIIGQDNREAVIHTDEKTKEDRTFAEKGQQDREALRTQENPNVAKAADIKPPQSDEEKAKEADTAVKAKEARDKAVADAEAKAKAKAAKKDDKSSAVDDVLK